MKVKEFSPIIKLMDEGVQKELDLETKVWNERLYKEAPYKGGKLDRFPLSPSQIGKCGLALARNLSHYMGLSDYPRANDAISPRVSRIFARGHLLESALISDLEKFTPLKIDEQQKKLELFSLAENVSVVGSIDGIAVHDVEGVKVLLDFKSKGSFYSANFTDSISQFFKELMQTGLVEEPYENCFYITNAKKLFDIISLDEFFVDYLLQLNAYAFGLLPEGVKVDFVSLYYENKNSCANYEVRWTPSLELFEYAKKKFQFIYDTVTTKGAEEVPKEFALGSARCRLCDYNEMCWGKYEPKTDSQKGKFVGQLAANLDKTLQGTFIDTIRNEKVVEEVLTYMSQKELTHIKLDNGLTYERKFLKSPKPHYELRLTK